MKKMLLFLLALVLPIGFAPATGSLAAGPRLSAAARSPQAASSPDFAAVEAVALQELKDTNTPGASIAVIRGDHVVWSTGVGVSSVDTGAPVTPDMLFRLGSTTKMFTAAAVVSLGEEGKLKLDEPIGAHVPGLDPSIARLTAHQLLSHSAGLRDEAVMMGMHDDVALAAGVRAMTKDMFFAEPGRLFWYSNPGFWIAGRLAEAVDGRPYADVMTGRLFNPLGMKRTTLRPTMAMTWPLAQGHEVAGGKALVLRPAADNVANWPAGSIFSSVEDLSRWVIALLNGGALDGKQALSASLFQTLATPAVDQPGEDHPRYAYGLTVVTRRGVRFVEHGGSRAGYGSFISMAPDRRVGIIVLANRTGSSLPKTVEKAQEVMLQLEPKAAIVRRPAQPMTAAEMEKYAGTYSQVGGEAGVNIGVKDGALYMRAGSQDVPVIKVGPNEFETVRAGGARGRVVFVLGEGGRAAFVYQGTRAQVRVE